MIINNTPDVFENLVEQYLADSGGDPATLQGAAYSAAVWLESRLSGDRVNNATALFLRLSRMAAKRHQEVLVLRERVAELERSVAAQAGAS